MPRASPRTVARKAADPDSQEFHHKLKRLVDRKAKGREYGTIAEQAGISASLLSQILNGNRPSPSFMTIYRLLKVLPATLREFDEA
jgi:predicted transcriptional regulator